MNQHGDQRSGEDPKQKHKQPKTAPGADTEETRGAMPKEIRAASLSDDNESVFLLKSQTYSDDSTLNRWSRRVHQPSTPKAFHTENIMKLDSDK